MLEQKTTMLTVVLSKNVEPTVRQTTEDQGGISMQPGIGAKLGTLGSHAPYGHLDQVGAVS